jgi:hypothetical protein
MMRKYEQENDGKAAKMCVPLDNSKRKGRAERFTIASERNDVGRKEEGRRQDSPIA